MVKLQIQNAHLSFGQRVILDNASIFIDEKTRACLSGANGCGKSTLLKAITGIIPADNIDITLTKGALISYLPQSDIVLKDECIYKIAEEGYERFHIIHDEIKAAEEKLADTKPGDNYTSILNNMALLNEKLEECSYHQRRGRIEHILKGLGFKQSDFTRLSSEFSGGYQMRLALGRILIENPDILLLDEPTNYLDIESITWLKSYLKSFNGGVVLVSHDQDFLDSTIDNVYELFNGKLTKYAGSYTKYLKTRAEEIEALVKAYNQMEKEIEKTEQFIERFRYKATKSKQVQSKLKALDKKERIVIPDHLKKLSFSFNRAPHSGNDIINIEHLHKAYGDNVIYDDFTLYVKKKERIAITGSNGRGKSTLLRMLASLDNDYSGKIEFGSGVKVGYFAQDNAATLNEEYTVLEEIEHNAQTADIPRARNLLGSFLFSDDDVFKKTKVLSGGEKSRLSLLKILLHPVNLLILDEPTSHLDINSKNMLAKALTEYDGTLIFVSHDKHFIKQLATKIVYLAEDGINIFEGDYDYFEFKLNQKENEENNQEKQKVEKKVNLSHVEAKSIRNTIQKKERQAEKLSEDIDKITSVIKDLEYKMGLEENYSFQDKITKIVKQKEIEEEKLLQAEEEWMVLLEELEELKQ